MSLSSELAVNRLKLSNTAGKTSFNTGSSSIAAFKVKSKTKTTFREIFGNCAWADPNSFGDYIQALNAKDLNASTPILIETPETGTISSQCVVYESQGDVFNPFTGDPIPSGTIVFLSIDTFVHDIGDVEIPSPIYTAQSNSANTDIDLVNGNRAIGVIL